MEWPRLTALVIVAAVLALVLYDLVAYAAAGDAGTSSRVVLRLGERSLAFVVGVSVLFGVLVGHLLLPQRPRLVVPGAAPPG